MDLFSRIPDEQAIVYQGGLYRQVELYQRAGRVYVKHSGGYARVLKQHAQENHTTTVPKLVVIEVSRPVADQIARSA